MPGPVPAIDLERELGSGATGRVRLGRLREPLGDLPAGRSVAVKELRSELVGDARAREAFRLEGEIGAAVEAPGLVRILHSGRGGGEGEPPGPYLVMLYVPGRTLRDVLADEGPLPEQRVRAIAAQLTGALAALHSAGFVHGDVKPENVRLDERGNAVLMDLGFARRIAPGAPRREDGGGGSAGRTAERARELLPERDANPGSLAYLAPERARGERATPASDVFALGLTLYELATGRHPFRMGETPHPRLSGTGASSGLLLAGSLGEGADRLLAELATARAVPPSRLVPELSPFLDALLLEMLHRNPSARTASDELARRWLEQEGGAWWAEVQRAGSLAPEGAPPDERHLTPLVGRARELERLLACYAAVAEGPEPDGGVVWLTGPASSGKSRLVGAFAERARTRVPPPQFLNARCPPFPEARPCDPLWLLLERTLRLEPGRALDGEQREALGALVPPQVVETLEQALDPDFEGASQASVPVALARWLTALARRAPLIVFIDDLNHADRATLSALEALAATWHETRGLLVLGHRDHEPDRNPEPLEAVRASLLHRACGTELALGPLSAEDVLELVEGTFHRTAPRRRLAEVLWQRSRGNPGLVVELLRGLIQRREAHPHSKHEPALVLEIAPEDLPLPASLATLIGERLRGLDAGDRAWLQRFSVVGGRLEAGFVRRAFPTASEAEVERAFERLGEKGWLSCSDGRWRFARPALREAVYRTLSEERRRRAHGRAADALRPARGGRITLADAFQRAFHLRAAGRDEELLALLRPLTDALLRRGQPLRVFTLAEWGLEALDRLGPRARDRDRIHFLEVAADAADRIGERGRQREWLDRLSDLDLSPERDAEDLARVYLLHGRYAVSTGQYGLARGMLRNAVELSERHGRSPELSSEAARRLSAVQAHVGELGEARRLARRSLELAAHAPQQAVSWLQVALVDLLEDRLEDALRDVDRALRLLRRAVRWNLPGAVAAAHMLRGRIYRLTGRPRRALGSMTRAVRLAYESGERRLEAEAAARLGGLHLDLDRPEEAEARLRDALLLAGRIEDRRGQALAGLWLGILLHEADDAEAQPLLERVQRLSRETGLGRIEALTRAIQARVALGRGELERADRDSLRAREQTDRTGAELSDQIVIHGTRALVLDRLGRHEEAVELTKELRRKLRRTNERFENPVLRRRHRAASTRLLESVLSPLGVIYPRVAAAGGAGGAGVVGGPSA